MYITRDIIFNKEDFFIPTEDAIRETIGEASLKEISERMKALTQSETVDQVESPIYGYNELETHVPSFDLSIKDLETGDKIGNKEEQSKKQEFTQIIFKPFPTPPESPAVSFLAHLIKSGQPREKQLRSPLALEQAFYTGLLAVPIAKNKKLILIKASISRYSRGKSKPK